MAAVVMALLIFVCAASAQPDRLEFGESYPDVSESEVVPQSKCRIMLNTNESDKYIKECTKVTDCASFPNPDLPHCCVSFSKRPESKYMQNETCDALANMTDDICSDTSDEKVSITVISALDTGLVDNPESPCVEGRCVRMYEDEGLSTARLAGYAANHFDYVSNNGHHIYASVEGESPDIDNCSTLGETWREGSQLSGNTSGRINSKLRGLIAGTGGAPFAVMEHFMHGSTEFLEIPIVAGLKAQLALILGRFLIGYGLKIAFLDQIELMCENIEKFILLKPDLTNPAVVNAVDFFIHLVEPFYLLAITVTAFYLLFASGSPLGRARAKSTLIRLILSIALVILTIPIFQFFLDITQFLSAFVLDLVDTDIAKTFMCQECINSLNYEFLFIISLAFFSGLFIALFQIIFYIGAFIILVMRYFMVIGFALFFPFTVLLNSFHLTRRMGWEMLYLTGWWIAMQLVEAFILVGIALGVMHMPEALVDEAAFRIGMGLAGYLLIIIGPLFAMGLMDWVAMMIISFSALETPWLSASADMAEEAEIEGKKYEEASPPSSVGPPKGPIW